MEWSFFARKSCCSHLPRVDFVAKIVVRLAGVVYFCRIHFGKTLSAGDELCAQLNGQAATNQIQFVHYSSKQLNCVIAISALLNGQIFAQQDQ